MINKCYTHHYNDGGRLESWGNDLETANKTFKQYKDFYYHRIDGPAIVEYDSDGNITYEAYFILNKHVWKDDFYKFGFIDAFIMENS